MDQPSEQNEQHYTERLVRYRGQLLEYRKQLLEFRQGSVTAEQKAIDDYGKALMSLSGGALGISIVFIDKIVGDDPALWVWALTLSWLCWSFSILSILLSYLTSHKALRTSVTQIDSIIGEIDKSVQLADDKLQNVSFTHELPGGAYSKWTEFLNNLSCWLFVVGVCLMIVFCIKNIGGIL